MTPDLEIYYQSTRGVQKVCVWEGGGNVWLWHSRLGCDSTHLHSLSECCFASWLLCFWFIFLLNAYLDLSLAIAVFWGVKSEDGRLLFVIFLCHSPSQEDENRFCFFQKCSPRMHMKRKNYPGILKNFFDENKFNSLFYPWTLKLIFLWKSETERDFPSATLSPKACNSQSWVGPGSGLQHGTQSMSPTWRTQSDDLSLLLCRVCISKKLEWAAEAGLQSRHSIWDVDTPRCSAKYHQLLLLKSPNI